MAMAKKLSKKAREACINKAIVGFQIPMMSIPKLYSALELSIAYGMSDAELKKVVAEFPGVMESV